MISVLWQEQEQEPAADIYVPSTLAREVPFLLLLLRFLQQEELDKVLTNAVRRELSNAKLAL